VEAKVGVGYRKVGENSSALAWTKISPSAGIIVRKMQIVKDTRSDATVAKSIA
jgi:hypothetical protein